MNEQQHRAIAATILRTHKPVEQIAWLISSRAVDRTREDKMRAEFAALKRRVTMLEKRGRGGK